VRFFESAAAADVAAAGVLCFAGGTSLPDGPSWSESLSPTVLPRPLSGFLFRLPIAVEAEACWMGDVALDGCGCSGTAVLVRGGAGYIIIC